MTSGDADLIITLISEIVPVPGLELVGPLPAEFQNYVSFAAGIGSKARNVEAARALIAFLSSPGASPAFTAKGIESNQIINNSTIKNDHSTTNHTITNQRSTML